MSEKQDAPDDTSQPAEPNYSSFQVTQHASKVVIVIVIIWFSYLWNIGSLAPTNLHALKPVDAEGLLSRVPLIDGHNDFLMLVRYLYHGHVNDEFSHDLEKGDMLGHFDIPRAEAGKLGGTFWSAFANCPSDGFDFSDENYADAVRYTLEQIDLFNRISEKYPKYFTLASDAAQAEEAFAAGRLISPLIIEGLHQIGNSLATLRLYHKLGVRYATLTWNCHNKYADAALVEIDGETQVSKPYHGGISKAGRGVILEMNRLGMMIDLSHVSDDTMRDVLRGRPEEGWNGSLAPPIFSHSSARAICPHPRNVPDDILHLVKQRNSIVMINFAPDFVSCKAGNSSTGIPDFVPETSTLDHVVKHIMHIGELIGYDHVGLGSDFDGIPSTPKGLEDVSKYPDLINALLKKGISAKDAANVAGKNILRVWHEIDKVAARLQKEIDPVEDELTIEGDLYGIYRGFGLKS